MGMVTGEVGNLPQRQIATPPTTHCAKLVAVGSGVASTENTARGQVPARQWELPLPRRAVDCRWDNTPALAAEATVATGCRRRSSRLTPVPELRLCSRASRRLTSRGRCSAPGASRRCGRCWGADDGLADLVVGHGLEQHLRGLQCR